MKHFLLFAFALVLFGCGETSQTLVAPQSSERPVFVLTKTEYQPTLDLTGTVEAQKDIVITSKLSGRIDEVLIDTGDIVQKGQVILRYSTENDQNQVAHFNALQTMQTVSKSIDDSINSAEIALENARTESQQVELTQKEQIESLKRTLQTQVEQSPVLVSQVLNLLDSYLQVTIQFQNNSNPMASSIGSNDAIQKQTLKNQTLDLIQKQAIGKGLDIVDLAEERLSYLQSLQKTLSAFDIMVKNSAVVAGFSTQTKQSVQQEVGQVLQSLNQSIAQLETTIQSYKTTQEQAALQILSAQNRIKNAEKARDIMISQGDSQIQQVQSQINITQSVQNEFELKSPFSGVVTDKIAEVGQLVQVGQPLFHLADTSSFKVVTTVPDVYVDQVRVGDLVHISLDGHAKLYEGQITRIDPSVNPRTRKLGIEVTFSASDEAVKIGLFARLTVLMSVREGFFIPETFIFHSFEGPSVLLATGDRIFVQLGNTENNQIEITSDLLQEGYPVVLP